jgi:hypothetical protein
MQFEFEKMHKISEQACIVKISLRVFAIENDLVPSNKTINELNDYFLHFSKPSHNEAIKTCL